MKNVLQNLLKNVNWQCQFVGDKYLLYTYIDNWATNQYINNRFYLIIFDRDRNQHSCVLNRLKKGNLLYNIYI